MSLHVCDTMAVQVSSHPDTYYAHVATHYATVSKRNDTSCVTQKIVSTHVSLACIIDMDEFYSV